MHASFAIAGVDARSVIDADPDVRVVTEEVLRRYEAGMLAYPTAGA
jgi:hypothetical protein